LGATNDSGVELTLDPVELGKVRFEFLANGDQIQINLVVERRDTLELMRSYAELLRAELSKAGFESSSFSFSQWTSQGNNQRSESTIPGHKELGDIAIEPPVKEATQQIATTDKSLDLRI
jgi:flagellar hook-length control protein FliK